MSKPTISMPASLARRPQHNGMPIPYMSPLDSDGKPLFSVDAIELKLHVIKNRLCGLCGEALGQWIGFIGEIDDMKARIFQQPGMHVDCLMYAASVCPYIANPQYVVHSRANVPGRTSNVVLLNSEVADDPRPERLLIYVASEYQAIGFGGDLAVRVAPHKKIIWIDKD